MPQEEIYIFYTDDDKDDIALFQDAAAEVSAKIKLLTQLNGTDLLQQLNDSSPAPAMIFMDWNMPGKNGDEILTEIRRSKAHRQIPVLIFSTSSSGENIETSRRLGANMYITKPTSFNDLVDIIRYCLTIDWNNFSDPDKFVYRPVHASS